MAVQTRAREQKTYKIYPLMDAKERLLVWRQVRGMWKNRKPDPIKELKKIRAGWDRKLPSPK